MDEAGIDRAECSRKVAGAIRSLVNARDLAARQCYGKRRRDLGLLLYRWTTSEPGLVLGGWIEPRMHR